MSTKTLTIEQKNLHEIFDISVVMYAPEASSHCLQKAALIHPAGPRLNM